MKLSDLHTSEHGIIVKVTGHGSFRKRIVEMGFIKGKKVDVLLNAPLMDPVKYKIMGYEVSLRRTEAEMIEVVSEAEAKAMNASSLHDSTNTDKTAITTSDDSPLTEKQLEEAALKRHRIINVALVGNPNCGKTSLFNFASGAHERVGNYSGVTVDAKVGHAEFEGYTFNLVDLPGTYSLSAYSPEELYVRKQIIDKTPDVIINVLDASNLERNLYLTTQLIDMNLRMVCALNMFDETQRRGDKIDINKLSELFGVPMVPTVFKSGEGVKQLFHQIIELYESNGEELPHAHHIHINHGHEIENGITHIQEYLKKDYELRQRYSTRYLAIKLLENDSDTVNYLQTRPNASEIFKEKEIAETRVKEETGEDCETAIMDAKYGFIHGALQEAQYETGKNKDTYRMTEYIDRVITNRYLGFPIFILMLFIMFSTTFIIGQFPMDWIDAAVAWFGEIISQNLPDGPIKAMLVDGVIGGVGAVIVFLPQILILYFFLILPLMSCSARLPIYIMITGSFFALKYRSLVMLSLYVIGIAIAVILSRIFSTFVVKGEDTPFVMELPPYRFPTWKAMGRHTWEKGKQYLKKMGGIILIASIIVWALGYFPHDDTLSPQQQQEQSFIGKIGKTVEPVFRPQGFDWKIDVGLISGVGAKEIVASTMGVLYSNNSSFSDDNNFNDEGGKYQVLHRQMTHDIAQLHGITDTEAAPIATLTAYCFLLFVLLYFPCIATIAAIKGETGSWKWALFAAGYTTLLAWVVSAAVFQIGRLFI